MSEPTKYLFAKFRMQSEPRQMQRLMISEDLERVRLWNKDDEENSPPQTKATTIVDSEFKRVGRDFEDSMAVFERTVPFVMSILPFAISMSGDHQIREFVARVGERWDQGDDRNEYETYRLKIDHVPELNKRLESFRSIATGVSSLPAMFIVGLISAYDKFLSNLIRAIFICRPELLSSSDRNISFKDLVEIGSVDAARNRIIEKEVETVIRDSHVGHITWTPLKTCSGAV